MFDKYGGLLLLGRKETKPDKFVINVTSVFRKISRVDSTYRVHEVQYVEGENRRDFCNVENGFSVYFSLDTYYNARYCTERLELCKVLSGRTLAVSGAGVGVFALYLSSNFESISNFEPNPCCREPFTKNMLANKVFNSSFFEVNTEILLKKNKVYFSHYLIVLPLCREVTLAQIRLIMLKHSRAYSPVIVAYLQRTKSDEVFLSAVQFWKNLGYSYTQKKVKTYSSESSINRLIINKQNEF
jgi:tRNA G37 N-methylase Trm5